jgi:PAS domain S-box-containing protein
MKFQSVLNQLTLTRNTPLGVSLLYAVFAAVWIVLSGYLLTITVADPVLQNRIELAKGLAFVAVTSGVLYLLLKNWNESKDSTATITTGQIAPPKSLPLLLTLIFLVLVVPLIDFAVYQQRAPQTEQETYADLSAIARLKSGEIKLWMKERTGDAQSLADNSGFAKDVQNYLLKRKSYSRPSEDILNELSSMQADHGFDSILLFDADGRLLSSIGNDVNDPPRDLMRLSLDSNQEQFSDLYRDSSGIINMDWIVPIIATRHHIRRAVAAVVLRTMPEKFLYPLIQTWPTNSASGETLLVRREDGAIRFLNQLRFSKGAALSLTDSLSNPNLPVAIADNRHGTTSGLDYRQVPVLAAYEKVTGTPWYIIAKLDRAEAMQPVRTLLYWISGVGTAAVVIVMSMLVLMLRQQQRAHRLSLMAGMAKAVKESELRYRTLIGTIPDLVWLKDKDGTYLKCNRQFERLYGARETDIIGKTDYDFVDREIADFFREHDRMAMAAGKPSINEEWLTFAENGYRGLFETIKTPMQDEDGNLIGVLGIARDITERERSEEALRKLSQAVEQSPSSIVITDLNANIEYANPAFAKESGYGLDEAIGSNPRLLHSGKTPKSTYDDMWARLKRGESWKGEFINRRKDGSEYIEMALISPVFQPDGRMTHYLAVKENITEQKQAREQLAESERHFRSLFENMLEGYAYCRMIYEQGAPVDFVYIAVNQAFETLTGLSDVIGRNVTAVIPGIRESNPELFEYYGRVAMSGLPEHLETHVEGLGIWFSIAIYSPRKEYFVAVFENITKRKDDEAKVQRLTQLYAALSQCNEAIVRCTSEEELLPQICRDAVTFGGMSMAWIGMVDEDGNRVKPVAFYGMGTDYLDDIRITLDADEPFGQGPTGAAIRDNRPYWCQDYLHDPATAPWLKRGKIHGWKSSAALPLHRNGFPVGSLTLYSHAVNAFDEEVRRLLVEMAMDISFALDNFERETEREKALKQLKINEVMLSEMSKLAKVGGWEFDPETGQGSWTPEVALIHDMDPEDPTSLEIGMNYYQGESKQKIEAAISAAISDGTPYDLELEMVTAKGNRKWVRTMAQPIMDGGKVVKVRGSFQDITQRKLAEEEMVFKNTVLQTQQEASLDAILVVDDNGRIISYNQQFIGLWRLPTKMVNARDDSPVLEAVINQVENPEAFSYRVQYLYEHRDEKSREEIHLKDGKVIDRYSAPITAEDGNYYGRVWYFRDITERKRAEQDIADSEQRFRGLVEQSLAGILIIQDSILIYVNPRCAEIIGHGSVDDLIGHDALYFVAEADQGKFAEAMRKLIDREQPSIALDFDVIHKDGNSVTVGAHVSFANYHGKPSIIGLIQDISEKKRDEARILNYVAELKATFLSTVQLATSLSEMRDPYTAGHERRVSEIAVAIATELGLSGQRIEGIKVAGFLHDIGKISIPAEILVKPGRLTETEYALVQGHAQASYEVLKHVEFPWPVATIALQHHERMDGSGYPNRLKGDEILLESRIMAVADVVEAMASHRPYRPGLGIEKALAEIERGNGTLYDPVVTDACVRLFHERGFVLPDR